MGQSPSPFTPGYNQVPGFLAGREEILGEAREAIDQALLDGRTPPAMVLVGPRGMGKSVLLQEIARRAEGWLHLALDVPEGGQLSALLIERAERLMATAEHKRDKQLRVTDATLRAGVAGVGAELHLSPATAGRGTPTALTIAMERALDPVMAASARRSTGLLVTLDEAQNAIARGELQAIAAWHQRAVTQNWPVVLVIAGLPALSAKGIRTAYERANWFDVERLSPQATVAALVRPAADAGRPFEVPAAVELARHTGGYPYAVQLYGHHAWRASAGEASITPTAVQSALPSAAHVLERNLYRQRWAQASPKEREYVTALAHLVSDGVPPTGAGVASFLGVTPKELSWVRQGLIDKGTLVAVNNQLSFVVPGFAAYVFRQERAATIAELLEASSPQGTLEGSPGAAVLGNWPPGWSPTDELGW